MVLQRFRVWRSVFLLPTIILVELLVLDGNVL
jgi:hypothetical protein